MRPLSILLGVIGAGVVGLSDPAQADVPPEVQKRAIQALSEDLLYPGKSKIHGLASALSTDGVWTTCGYVFPMGSDGVRNRQWSFIVKVAPNDAATVSIARDNNVFMAILDVCHASGVAINAPGQGSPETPRLIDPDN